MIPELNGKSGGTCDFTIEVTGTGEVTAAPNRTLITLGAVTEGKEVLPAQNENAEKMNAVIDALVGLGIPRENIRTESFSIEPQYDYVDGRQVFRGYKVTHLLEVALSGVDGAGTVIDTATAHGANTVTDITFLSSEAAAFAAQALQAAVRSAQTKAAGIAAALGVSLSAVPCKVEEISPDNGPILFKAAAMSATTPIAPGQLTFKAAVRAWYLFA
ncbi:SIMPL domain-containing protein [Paenibacillus nanensis]|nr:SIMPL domain-containing protein [Paenibacillus nanensis]